MPGRRGGARAHDRSRRPARRRDHQRRQRRPGTLRPMVGRRRHWSAPMSDAATAKPDPDADKRQRETLDKLLARSPVVSTGAVTLVNGRKLDYEVNASFMPVSSGGVDAQRGEPVAAVLCVAYTVRSGTPRPLCFAFNGGPGSASVWLHLGALGPKRVAV